VQGGDVMRPFLTAALLCLAALPARAHPHVWIDARATLRFEGGAIVAIGMHWRFDEVFSDFVLGEYDADGNAMFDAEEKGKIEQEAFVALADLGWLTHLRVDGQAVPLPAYRGFEASAADGIVSYRFELPLTKPVDPARSDVLLGVYDESYYIDVAMEESEPVLFTGQPPEACRFEMVEDTSQSIYFGMVHPIVAEVRCAAF
jgi:ABC-type uncharacterized transport system substrate-binding protein